MSGNYIPNFIKIHEKLIKLLRFEDVKKALIICYVPWFFPFFNDFSHIFDIFCGAGGRVVSVLGFRARGSGIESRRWHVLVIPDFRLPRSPVTLQFRVPGYRQWKILSDWYGSHAIITLVRFHAKVCELCYRCLSFICSY